MAREVPAARRRRAARAPCKIKTAIVDSEQTRNERTSPVREESRVMRPEASTCGSVRGLFSLDKAEDECRG